MDCNFLTGCQRNGDCRALALTCDMLYYMEERESGLEYGGNQSAYLEINAHHYPFDDKITGHQEIHEKSISLINSIVLLVM